MFHGIMHFVTAEVTRSTEDFSNERPATLLTCAHGGCLSCTEPEPEDVLPPT